MITGSDEVVEKREIVSSYAICIGIFLMLVGGCSTTTPDSLAELVLREMMDEIPSDFVACVSIDGLDADETLLRTLRGSTRVVVPASECVWVLDANKGSYEKASGRKAMLINARVNLARDEVEYIARHHGRWATMITLRVKEEQGRWKIMEVIKYEEA
jgi:hypothetical protein